MSFGKFIDYLEMAVEGTLTDDPAYRAYDLLYQATDSRLKGALRTVGFKQDELSVALAECMARCREWGYEVSDALLQQSLLEWLIWQRINSGEYVKWKYR